MDKKGENLEICRIFFLIYKKFYGKLRIFSMVVNWSILSTFEEMEVR